MQWTFKMDRSCLFELKNASVVRDSENYYQLKEIMFSFVTEANK